MFLNKEKNKLKLDKAAIYYKKNLGCFYIKIYNKFFYFQYIIKEDPVFTFFYIIQFLYKIGIKIN